MRMSVNYRCPWCIVIGCMGNLTYLNTCSLMNLLHVKIMAVLGLLLVVYLSFLFSFSFPSCTAAFAPPVAKKVKHEMTMFGDVRVDNYYWLRDDNRSNPEVLSYLNQENSYTDFVMNGTKHIEDQIFAQLKGQRKEAEISTPSRRGCYYYYSKSVEGKEHSQHFKRLVMNCSSPVSVYDTMPTGHEAPLEYLILDENIMAKQHKYYDIETIIYSPNGKLVAYAEDTIGNEIYTVHIIDAESRAHVGKPLVGLTTSIAWAGDEALVYVSLDEFLRPDKVWLHKLGSEQSSDILLYHEKDDAFILDLRTSEGKGFLFVWSESKTTRFVFYLDINKLEDGLKVLTKRENGVYSSISQRGNYFFILRRTEEFFNSELLASPLDNISSTTVLLPHRKRVKLQSIQLFKDHLVVFQREDGLIKVNIYRLPAEGEPLKKLENFRTIDFADPVYWVGSYGSAYNSSILRFSYSSMRTPPSIYDYDMNTGVSVLKNTEIVLGGFNASNYVTERRWATATDGTRVPISIVYRKNLVKLDGSDPLLLYGYGAYEFNTEPAFSAPRIILLDRGFVYAIAHIRGGGEMGRKWYDNGKLLKKRNTFTDFITCAEYLIQKRYVSKEKLCIDGVSAGGLLIGAVLNMRPDLFKAAVARVPFVDILTTMLDRTLPLTTEEYEEWGDPRKENLYFYMKSYSPVDNVKRQNYPNMFVTTSLYDSDVIYSEPTKFVAKLRDMKTDDNLLIFKCNLHAGHFSASGWLDSLREIAFHYVFILKSLGMI